MQVMEHRHVTAQTDIKTVQRQRDLDYVGEVALGRGSLILARSRFTVFRHRYGGLLCISRVPCATKSANTPIAYEDAYWRERMLPTVAVK
jgi:hypothetical protein